MTVPSLRSPFARLVLTGLALIASAPDGAGATAVSRSPVFRVASVRRPADGTVDALRRMLDGPWRESPLERERLRRRLVALGDAVVPAFYSMLVGESADAEAPPAPTGGDPGTEVDEGTADPRPLPLDRASENLLYEVLEDLPSRNVAEQLTRQLGTEPGLFDRVLVTRILGRVGDRGVIPSVLDIADGIEPMHITRPYVRAAFEGALYEILARDPRAFDVLELRMRALDERFYPSVVRALGETRRAEALPIYQKLAAQDAEVDALVLKALGKLDRRALMLADSEAVSLTHPYLTSESAELRSLAATTLAGMGDGTCFDALLFLLDDRERGVSRAALTGLHELTGLNLGPDPRRWRRWHAAELGWRASRAAGLARKVRSLDAGTANAALRELSHHPLFAIELLPEVLRGLEHADHSVVTATCTALERLDSPLAIPELVDALGHHRPRVNARIVECLRALSRENVPGSLDDWIAWMEG